MESSAAKDCGTLAFSSALLEPLSHRNPCRYQYVLNLGTGHRYSFATCCCRARSWRAAKEGDVCENTSVQSFSLFSIEACLVAADSWHCRPVICPTADCGHLNDQWPRKQAGQCCPHTQPITVRRPGNKLCTDWWKWLQQGLVSLSSFPLRDGMKLWICMACASAA